MISGQNAWTESMDRTNDPLIRHIQTVENSKKRKIIALIADALRTSDLELNENSKY